MNTDGFERIVGSKLLVDVFGYWPSFHDAEVLWLRLDRGPWGDGMPSLEAMVHAFEMTNEIDTNGHYILRHHVLVHLRFIGIQELKIEDFNHQNALNGLAFTELPGGASEPIRWEVRFDSAFGIDATLRCFAIELVSVRPCTKTGEPA